MSIKSITQFQQSNIVDQVARNVAEVVTPLEGWLRTVRKALGMSGADVANKLEVTRARITAAEHAELDGGITLKSMQAMAEAMDCKFVYAIVPKTGNLEAIIVAQARKKAEHYVATASQHMALENQSLSSDKNAAMVERLTRELTQERLSDFWKNP